MRKKSKPNKGKAAKKASVKAKKKLEYSPAKFDASKCSTPPASSLSTTGFYNPKIVDHFSNPHNYGKMENPDAIGRAGNPVCLIGEERIHANPEVMEIARIEEAQKVLTHRGNYEKVTLVSSRNYNGKVRTLKNKLGKVTLTLEHLIYAIKVPKGDKFARNKGKRKLIPAWYHTNQLEKGDIILYPIIKETIDFKDVKIDIPKPRWDFKSIELPKKVPLNSDLLRLFGYYLSEGNVQDKPCKTYLTFTLNIKEKDIVEDIRDISKKLFNLEVKVKEKPQHKTVTVGLYSARLARFFKKLFGNGASSKKIPEFIMKLPLEKQKALIFGIWKGDGYVNLNRDGPRAGYSTTSYQLAEQVKILLLRQRIIPSIYKENEKTIKGVKHLKNYRVHVGQRDALVKLCKILNIDYCAKSYESIDSWFDENYVYTPITDIKEFDYSGKVYNLEVIPSHSFISEAFCLHNCGDVMEIFIKVKNNKIIDIKFQTLGCAAAIATSSMITDLAKGKTLEQALNITREDVAVSLGGLPPIKMHCSNLAAEALHNAIADYRKKKD